MSKYLNYILDAVRRPREQLTRGQHQLRYAWELAVHCGRQLTRHRAEGMAAELTYRTIFSLIPVVVLGLVMFRVFGGLDEVQTKVEDQVYSFFGVPTIPITDYTNIGDSDDEEPGDTEIEIEDDGIDDESNVSELVEADGGEPPEGEADPPPEMLDAESDEATAAEKFEDNVRTQGIIRNTLQSLTAKISSVDFASIGVFGLLLFIYAAVALADSVEYLFNRIYDAPSQRPIHIRVAIHWSIITLGSGLLAMSLYLSSQVIDWLGTFAWFNDEETPIAMVIISHLLSVVASWVLLFLLYALMPNTSVSVRAAAAGSGVGAMLWEAAKYAFQIYVAKAVPYSALYGSLGLIPLFLFWIYVTWLIILFGLILTYTLQTLNGRRLGPDDRERDALPAGDPDWMLPIMTEVACAFHDGNAIGRQQLADHLGLSGRIIRELEATLIDAGLLRRTGGATGEEEALTLAKPAEQIAVAEILGLAHQTRPTSNHPAWQTLASLKQAEREAAGDRKLSDLLGFSLNSKV